MDRLTTYDKYGRLIVDTIPSKTREMIRRLAAYEDTGMTPEEVLQLKGECFGWKCDAEKYKTAEAEGRLLALPCKAGTLVWQVNFDRRRRPITEVRFDANLYHAFGKTVFLTREEAEAALGRADNG